MAYGSSFLVGNASSLPPRLPFISLVLRILRDQPFEGNRPVEYSMVRCSYRGYWASEGRPSENGITLDVVAALEWVRADYKRETGTTDQPILVIIWGQSIGAGVSTIWHFQQRHHCFPYSRSLRSHSSHSHISSTPPHISLPSSPCPSVGSSSFSSARHHYTH